MDYVFERQVWETLSRIDTLDHVDQIKSNGNRPAVTYLSWSKAWMLVKRDFPGTTYAHNPELHHADGTVEVEVVVDICAGVFHFATAARLAVMDNRFNAIANPTARQINDSRQRALVKALAFAGLGLHLWGDTSIPVGTLADPIDFTQVEMINGLIKSTKTDLKLFLRWADAESVEAIPVERYSSAIALLQAKAKVSAANKRVTKAVEKEEVPQC
jgi:hypothetical protein